jgi:hypothetical protein
MSEGCKKTHQEPGVAFMKRNLSQVAIMALLFSSLAFASDKDKSASISTNAQPASSANSDNAAPNDNPCVSADKKDNKKDKNKAKPAPSDQEEQFNKVLMGIYG